MTGILAPLLVGLRRRKTASSRKRADGSSGAGPRRVARRLADAIDRAMAMGLWEHADRLAEMAAKLAPGPPLTTTAPKPGELPAPRPGRRRS